MLKEHAGVLKKLMILADLCLVSASFFFAYFALRGRYELGPIKTYLIYLPVILTIWGYLLVFFKMYDSFRLRNVWEILFIIFKTTVTGCILFGGVLYFFKLDFVSQSFFMYVFLTIAAGLVAEKLALMIFFHWTRKRG